MDGPSFFAPLLRENGAIPPRKNTRSASLDIAKIRDILYIRTLVRI